MDFFNLLKVLSQGQKSTVIATFIQWPVIASILFLGSTEYQLFEYWEQLILSLAASILATFSSYTLVTISYVTHNIKGISPSDYLLYLPTLFSSVILVVFCDEITIELFRSLFIFTIIVVFSLFFALGFKYGKKTDTQDESNGVNNNTKRRRYKHIRHTHNHLILSYPIVFSICALMFALLLCVFILLL